MVISFNDIPSTTRTPGVYIEVDNSLALQGLTPWVQKALVLGQINREDMVTNGTFTGASTGWTLETGWAYGANNITYTAAGDNYSASQDIGAIQGVTYVITFVLSSGTGSSATLTPKLGGTSGSAITLDAGAGDGAHSVEIVCGTTDNSLYFEANATANVTLDDVTCTQKIDKAVNTINFVGSTDQAEADYGIGSQITNMIKKFKAVNPNIEMYACAQGDGTTQATGTITILGPSLEAGSIHLLVDGVSTRVGVSSGDSATAIALAIKNKINETTNLPVYASVSAGVVTVLAKYVGLESNDIDMRVNYNSTEVTPNGVTVTIVQLADGTPSTANPAVSSAITAMGDDRYDYIVNPYLDATNMGLLETELTRRFGPMIQVEAVMFSAVKEAYATLATWALDNSRNSPHVSVIGYDDAPNTSSAWAAVYAGVVSKYGNIDPARPFQTLPLTGLLPPGEGSVARLTREERNVLLFQGVSAWTVDAGGRILINRSITNYRLNAQGGIDPSYLDVNTMLTLMFIRIQYKTRMENRYPRHKLADDSTQVPAGSAIARPRDIRMETISLFGDLAQFGVIENLEDFKTNLVVERNANDVNRVDVLLPADLVNQFRILAAKLQFIL